MISVIIPTYNRAAYIEESVESVLSQVSDEKFAIEIIVVDDGSTDDTEKILKKFDKKITYIKIPHSGKPAVARNAGLGKAKGELIAFQDSDDIWSKDRLIKQIDYFNDGTVALVHGSTKKISKVGEQLDKSDKIFNGKMAQTDFKDLVQTNSISTLSVTVRTKILRDLGGFNESDGLRAVEDYELWLRIAATGKKLIYLPDTLAYYRVHEANISNEGFAAAGTSEYEAQALDRILRVLESILFDDSLSDSQIALVEKQIEQCVDGIFNARNPQYTTTRQPTISVLLPVYNGGKFVADTMRSILNQTYSDFEVVAINDGSKDNTAEIIRSFNDPRIKLYSQRNKGLVATCNKGIRLSRGEYIARHDADDISMPTRFEKELAYLTINPGVGVVSTFFTYMDENTNQTSITITSPFKPIDVKRAFYVVNPVAHGGTMTRKSIFEAVGGYDPDYIPADDYHIWTKAAAVTDIAILPESLYWYRVNPNGISATQYDGMLKLTDRIIKEQWKKPLFHKSYRLLVNDGLYYRNLDNPLADQIYHQYMSHQIEIAKQLFNHGYVRSGTKTVLAIIKLEPSNMPLLKLALKKSLKRLARPLGI